ncbi:hypothetical protein [Martelella sp. AD-3]|uniref:hypothetical protein n=1 Tax=Martelella sp. AD-3 TaxID=686597 RepID=UPI00126853EB|nr:hypothetical protein [Martelella sp. AD-3]
MLMFIFFLFCRAYRPFGLRCEPPAKQLATHGRACLQSIALSEFISQTNVEKDFGAKHRKADRPSPLMRRAVAAQQVEDLRNGRETKNVRAFCITPANAINTIRPPTQQSRQPYFFQT